jgi:argininosuccinate lyase
MRLADSPVPASAAGFGVTFSPIQHNFNGVASKSRQSQVVSRSGRFSSGPARDVAAFTESVSFDQRLWKHDIEGSMAHAKMLQQAGILSSGELKSIVNGLKRIATEITSGRFRWREDLEDVHMNIEAELTRRTPAGAKLHTGRSRNDQVALDMRLWLKDEIAAARTEIRNLQRALVHLAGKNVEAWMPGYTHLQRAQPVSLAHHLLAYVEMLERDDARLSDCATRVNVCPLGSGALAGSTLPLDRTLVATQLGFVDKRGKPRLTANSMDAVTDRDFIVEFCATAALVAVHLSRFAEDLVLWSSSEFNFIRIGDAYTTGSSLMPQKRNPDVAELTRGKSARVIGNLMSLLTLLKGLPMTYNRDLQEDKERLFDTADTVRACLRLCAAMLPDCKINRNACRKAAADPGLLATDLADYLVGKGVAFRDAHHAVGRIVAEAEKLSVGLDELSLPQLKAVHPSFQHDVSTVFNLDQAMGRRVIPGSPGTVMVKREIARWNRMLASPRTQR